MNLVGSLGRAPVELDARGAITADAFVLDWWIGAQDRWHVAAVEAAVRQRRLAPAPAYETAMRVAHGDVVQRVYGATVADAQVVVVEIENTSPAAIVAAFVLRDSHGRPGDVEVGGATVWSDGRGVLVLPRPPTDFVVTEKAAAFFHAMSHRSVIRAAFIVAGGTVDLAALPPVDDVIRGWRAQLDRGMRIVLPHEAHQDAIDSARADALLAAARPAPTAITFTTLEDWGFDREASTVWPRLSPRERRVAARRGPSTDLLRATRDALIRDDAGVIEVHPTSAPWTARGVEVYDAPTRLGRVSYAVRRHGDRMALLWELCDARPGTPIRAPGLDPSWSTIEPKGEALLAPLQPERQDLAGT